MPGDPDDGQYEEVSVHGHDDLWHYAWPHDGTILCGMGRKQPLHYDVVPVTCMLCIAKVTEGYHPALRPR